jgi:hypothetical protein
MKVKAIIKNESGSIISNEDGTPEELTIEGYIPNKGDTILIVEAEE